MNKRRFLLKLRKSVTRARYHQYVELGGFGYSSTDGALTIDDESLNGRMIPSYAGITTTLAANVDNATTANVSLTDLSSLDVEIGDYLR